MAHILNTIISDSSDCSTLILRDASQYDPTIPVSNGLIEIVSPLSDCSYPFPFEKGFCNMVIGCSMLEICCQDCFPSQATIPDGNYKIKMSVDPNTRTLVEFNYFRECQLNSNYIATACRLRSIKSDMSITDYTDRLRQLRNIKDLLAEAKWMAEESLNVEEALVMSNEALSQLNRFNHKVC